MITIAIVEDDEAPAKSLENLLHKYEAEIKDEIKIFKYYNAEEFLRNYKPDYDVLFIDIEMPRINGMDVACKIRESDENVKIIFVTNMVQYAVKGYSVNALDYFLKPVSYYALKLRMEQVRIGKEERLPQLTICLPGKVKSIPSSKVYYIEIMDHALTYHTAEGDFSITRGPSLSKMEKQLSAAGFMRCSSSYLVNLKRCSELKTDSVIVAGHELKISRGRKKDFVTKLSKTLMKNWGGEA